jgi:tRNA (cytidine/uridine-2'-O-)-methyltransferase
MRLALFQPDIPQNAGAAIRAAACLGAAIDIIEPCGFPLDSREVRRVAMDYGALAAPTLHRNWGAFYEGLDRPPARLVLMTTKSATPLWDFSFQRDDVILMGRESAGVPENVHAFADARLVIPMKQGARSLNIVVAAAVALAEAIRQLRQEDRPVKRAMV